jgi:hypothetical protein
MFVIENNPSPADLLLAAFGKSPESKETDTRKLVVVAASGEAHEVHPQALPQLIQTTGPVQLRLPEL